MNTIRGPVIASYPSRMLALRLSALLLLATLTTAQQTSAPPTANPNPIVPRPKLPFIDDKACPGKERTVPNVKIVRPDKMFSSWRDKRVLTATLKEGDEVTVLAGVNVIREPDRAILRFPNTDLASRLKPGDIVFRYGLHHPSGDWDSWGKGVWFMETYEEMQEKAACAASEKITATSRSSATASRSGGFR
jgi:hypothetical protein